MKLANYILKKLLFAVLTLFALSLVIFATSMFFSPRQRAMLFVSPYAFENPWAPDALPEIIEKYDLGAPFHVQYTRWLGEVLMANFGYSYLYHNSVMNVISQSFPATLELIIFAAPLIIFGGQKLGVFSAKRANRAAPREDVVDFATRAMTTLGYAVPSFVPGLLLLVIFYLVLGWFGLGRLSTNLYTFVRSPTSGWIGYTGLFVIDGLLNGRPDIALDAARHLVLPVITLATGNVAILVRITRSGMISELVKPYILTAKAKGLDEKGVIRHASKNSLTSVFTVSGILFATMLTGVVVTEYVFSIQGVGSLVVQAASRLDIALLVGLSLFFCTVFMLFNLVVDIAYAYTDPRVKL